VAAADQRFSHLISEEAPSECRVVDIGGAVAHATQIDCFKQNRTPSCRHPQIFRDIALGINRGPRSITPFPGEGARKHAHLLVFATPCARAMLIIIRAIRKRGRSATPRGEQATLKGGRREDRVRAAPAVSRAKSEKNTHTSIQVQRKQSGLPCAMVLRLTSRSPWRPAFCHHHPREACFSRT
jgi:hypothetical protein